MVRRTQSRGLGGSRVYKWPSGAGKTEIPGITVPTGTAKMEILGPGLVGRYRRRNGGYLCPPLP